MGCHSLAGAECACVSIFQYGGQLEVQLVELARLQVVHGAADDARH